MRTEQINYLHKAENMVMHMDIEEQAARAAKSVWQADDAESRLASLRQEAESLLCMWRKERQDIENKIVKTDREYWSVMQVDAPWSPVLKKVMASLAYKEGKISKEECSAREGIGRKILRIKNDLQQLSYDLEDAIDYLEGYLYPSSSQEENASQVADVPFASNFGIIAQTPKESLLKMLLRKQGQNMRTAFLNGVDKSSEDDLIQSMTDNKCWSLLEEAIKAEGLDEDENPDVEALWTLYNEGNFDAVVNEVKECFLNE